MKLKTLKDLEGYGSGYECDNTKDYKKELRAEAVKLVKHYRSLNPFFRMGKYVLHGRIIMLKDFFNLTEEDLD